jgi:hypothetical protein
MGQCATVARPSTVQADNNLVLEWLDDDSEAVHITLVQSKKKKRQKTQLENMAREPNIRSKRTTPSIYRNKGGQENNVPPNFLQRSKLK